MRGVLDRESRDSSKVSVLGRGVDKLFVPSRISCAGLPELYAKNPAIHKAMSETTFRHMKKQKFMEYRAPACESDYCQYCDDFDKKILPGWSKARSKAKEELASIMPGYFVAFDQFVGEKDVVNKPGAEAELLVHFIDCHRNDAPCQACEDA